MVNLNKEKKYISGCQIFKMNIVLMNTEEALRLRGCDKAKNNNKNNLMFSFGPRLKWTEHNNTAAIWSGRTKWSTEKSEADFLLSSFSYI